MGNGQTRQVRPDARAASQRAEGANTSSPGVTKDDSYVHDTKQAVSQASPGPQTHTGAVPKERHFAAGGTGQAAEVAATPSQAGSGGKASASKPPSRAPPPQPAAVAAAKKAMGSEQARSAEKPRRGEAVLQAQAALNAFSPEGSRYTLLRLIGKGAYGAVYLAQDSDGTRVAVKFIANAFTSATDSRRIFREISVMHHFSHPNIVQLRGIILPAATSKFTGMYIVSELMETDLHRVIHSRQDLTSDHISYFVYQLLCALQHLHAASVLHRDLKPSNLLVNSDCSLKVCDFGLARETDVTLSVALTEYVVTRWYRAPEVLLSGGKYTAAIDVWSVGCILGELLMRRPLFPGENYLHQLQLIMQTLGSPSLEDLHFVQTEAARQFILRQPFHSGVPLPSLFPHVRGPCLDLLQRMLIFDPAQRISISEALAHPFLARVRAARASVSEVPPPPPFTLIPNLRSMEVDDIRSLFVTEVAKRQGGNAAFTAVDSSAEQEEDLDAEPGSPPCQEPEEGREGPVTYYNAVDGSIDQAANTEYWAYADRELQEALQQARGVQPAEGDEDHSIDPQQLAHLLKKLQAAGNGAGGGALGGVPGAAAREQDAYQRRTQAAAPGEDVEEDRTHSLSSPVAGGAEGGKAPFTSCAPPERPLPPAPATVVAATASAQAAM